MRVFAVSTFDTVFITFRFFVGWFVRLVVKSVSGSLGSVVRCVWRVAVVVFVSMDFCRVGGGVVLGYTAGRFRVIACTFVGFWVFKTGRIIDWGRMEVVRVFFDT